MHGQTNRLVKEDKEETVEDDDEKGGGVWIQAENRLWKGRRLE